MFEINRSCSPENARSVRDMLIAQGAIEVKTVEEATELEGQGKMAFIDHTNNGVDSYSAEEMNDFRRTTLREFPEHQRRWGH